MAFRDIIEPFTCPVSTHDCATMLVAIASYSLTNEKHLKNTLVHLKAFKEYNTTHLDIVVDTTERHPWMREFNVTTRVWDYNVRKSLVSKHRALFEESMQTRAHDCYLYTEDDMLISPHALCALMQENKILTQAQHPRFDAIVMPRRFEMQPTRGNAKFLVDCSTGSTG